MSGELFRQPDPQLGYLIFGTTMGQLLSIPLLIAGDRHHRLGAAYPPPVNAVTQDRLKEKIARRIRAEGPLSVAAYMAMVLYDPERGYYVTRRPIGAGGDFITSPEISQIFGELIGIWCALTWAGDGTPRSGNPRRTGARQRCRSPSDLLRAVDALPEFRRALRLHLVEVSPILRAEQQRRLGMTDVVWLTRLEELPEGPLLVVANEFLDALPIRQLVARVAGMGRADGYPRLGRSA